MEMVKLFTHTDLDGVGCAILAYLAFGKENVDVEYCDYNNVNAKVVELLDNEELYRSYDVIYITDISVNEEVAAKIDTLDPIGDGKVILFDHHATALELTDKYYWSLVKIFDNHTRIKTCGTEIFYKYLTGFKYLNRYSKDFISNITKFVDIVRDYDTWRWKEELGDDGIVCKEVNDLLYIYGREKFINWCIDSLVNYPLGFPVFERTELTLLEQKQKDIDSYVSLKDKQLVKMEDQFGYTYGLVFAERYFSELGNKLSELHPEFDYIAMIDIADGKVSYRTAKDNLDLGGEIAHSFGGGGHRKAAGSVFDGIRVREMVVREVFK